MGLKFIFTGLFFFCTLSSFTQTWKELFARFDSAYRKRDYNEALLLGEKLIAVAKDAYGAQDSNYATSLYRTGNVCYFRGEYSRAEALYLEACSVRQKIWGENHPDYASCLNNLGNVYYQQKRFKEAEPLRIRAMEIRRKVLGEAHPDYVASVGNMALFYEATDQYEKAALYFNRAAELGKNVFGANHPDYARILNGLGALYVKMAEYEKAGPLYKQATEIRWKALGESHPDYMNSLNNLAILYKETGEYEKAESLYLKTREIIRKTKEETHPDFAQSSNNLAVLYLSTGKYEKAEPLQIQALELQKKLLGEKHPTYQSSLNNLGILYEAMGLYEKSEKLQRQALELRLQVSGENSLEYAKSLNNLGILYMRMFQPLKAEPLHIRAGEIRKKILGEWHAEYATSLNNLAVVYRHTEEFAKAESLYIRALEIWKKTLGEGHPNYAQALNNLARIYHSMGHHSRALSFFLEAEKIRKTSLGENHPDYASTLSDIALLYIDRGENEKAESLIVSAVENMLGNLKLNFQILSENEKNHYLENNAVQQNISNSYLFYNPNASARAITTGLNLQLFFKSLALADTRNMLVNVQNNPDSAVRSTLNRWLACKTKLAGEYMKAVNNRRMSTDSLEEVAEYLEKELSRYSSAFRKQQELLQISADKLQEFIEIDEAVVEFSRFRLYNKGTQTDSVIYGAYILKKTTPAPVFIQLFEEAQLQEIVSKAGKSATSIARNIYSPGPADKQNNPAAELYRLIWQPLEPYLKDVRKIAYSPAGKLHELALHALPAGAGLLMNRHTLQQYTSTREIALRKNIPVAKPREITVFANPDFSMDSTKIAAQRMNQSGAQVYSYAHLMPLRGGDNFWPDLPGTADEMKNIRSIFTRYNIPVRSFERGPASEENLKTVSGQSTQVLHIATHGFFLPAREENATRAGLTGNNHTLTENPLLRSGLVFSGGNYAWSGKTPIEGAEDGIVTAYEIAQLDLSNTELVVLSACETALGDVKGSEGVFGLQRAFKMAGVKKMIVSLWKVPDKETAELMTAFYTYWLKGKTIAEAFGQARADMRKKYPPFYWAAFILIE
jgi:CHAT domain-containing protein/Flp pilus assembly protein TadD